MSSPLSRRNLLTAAGAGALTAAVGASSAATTAAAAEPAIAGELPVISVDVAVIGAGLTGLSAARKLRDAGRSVHVVEADTRVGGRVWTEPASDGTPLNWGATFIGPTQDRVLALARELGVGTYKTWNSGKNIVSFYGGLKTYTGAIPPVDLIALLEIQSVMTKLNSWAKSIDPAAPWADSRAVEWDSQTFHTWVHTNINTAGARKLADLLVLSLFSVEMRDLSLLHVIWYIRTAGSNLDLLLNTAGGAQESQFDGGSQRLPEGLAAKLGAGAITLDSPVRRVSVDGAVTRVHSERVIVEARRVLVAVPPPMIPRIVFEPGLSAMKDQLCQRMPMGSVAKAIAIYDTPFWRAKGYTGQVTSDQGPVKITFDLSPTSGGRGVMMGFIDGQDAREFGLTSPAARRTAVLAQFAKWFGAEAKLPREYRDLSWDALPHHRGCPVAVPSPGSMVGFRDAHRTTEGPLHFASTESALKWAGYMDGAIGAGEAAAAEIQAAL